jgi:hypothetical protein
MRTTLELEDDDGTVFLAMSDHHRFGILGRRHEGELFMSTVVLPRETMAELIEGARRDLPFVEVVTGPEAKALFFDFDQSMIDKSGAPQ